MATNAESFLAPGAVVATFESNLTGAGRRSSLPIDREAIRQPNFAANPEKPQPVEIAAVLGEEISAIFNANLTDPIQRALTPPSISVTPEALNLPATVGLAPTRHQLQISSLGGTVNWSAEVAQLNGSGWLSAFPLSGSVPANLPSILTVEVNYAALGSASIYQGLVTITDTATGYVVAVPIAVVLSSTQARLVLSQPSFLYTVAGGGSAPPPQTLRVFNGGQGNLAWSIPANALPSWLSVSPLAGSSGGDPSLATSATLSVNNAQVQTMPSGVYQALLPVSASGAVNDPQLVTVTLQRVPGATPASPLTSPNGLLFVASQGGAAPAGQDLTIANGGGGTLTVQSFASTTFGGNWLALSPSGGTTASGPINVRVSVNPAGLSAGVYRGTIRSTFSSGASQEADVLLVVAPPGTLPQRLRSGPPTAVDGCTPQSMELIANTIGNGVSIPTSFPRVLLVNIVNSCGIAVNDAAVVASAEGSTITLNSLRNGTYSGTWVPQRAGATSLTITALHPSFAPVTRSYAVSTAAAVEGVQLPVLFTDGVVEGAGFTPRRPLAPGSILSIFGARLARQIAVASRIPLERELAGVRVRVGNQDLPLYFVAPDQINAQLPFEVKEGSSISVVVSANGLFTAPQNYLIAPAQPGIFIASTGAAILDGQSRLITPANPARPGDTLQIYANGLGSTEPPVESGAAGPPSSRVTNPVTVTIGGEDAPVVYQGLAPGFVGLYQVNVILPTSVPPGDAVPVFIRQNGITSNINLPATIPVGQP
ncbi:MAG: hypothetical protein A3J28_00900 [Acidobacteria bacterium RIFCSPLOWO2_12_FULL_60_22]|nr:MAG: hypothetical protein A3J28_00900 [Acidobacteria bacterium RIFCSPLOWO2_12_FULL_60_22]